MLPAAAIAAARASVTAGYTPVSLASGPAAALHIQQLVSGAAGAVPTVFNFPMPRGGGMLYTRCCCYVERMPFGFRVFRFRPTYSSDWAVLR